MAKSDGKETQISGWAKGARNAIADAVGTVAGAIKDSGNQIAEKYEQSRIEKDLKELSPVFEKDIISGKYILPSMIRIVEPDKRRLSSKACEGAIGFSSIENDLNIANIFSSSVNQLGLEFLPQRENEFFLVNPGKESSYINVNEYFTYIRKERVQELVRVAASLGASYVNIEYSTSEDFKKVYALDSQMKAGAGEKKRKTKEHDAIDTRQSYAAEAAMKVAERINDEESYKTVYHWNIRDPEEPILFFFKNDVDIKDLIHMRMEGRAIGHIYRFKCIQSIGIKNSEAGKLDAALKTMKCGGRVSVAFEMAKERATTLNYEIRF